MPEIRYYRVTQTREVKVTANSTADAVQIADAAFTNGQKRGVDVIDGPANVWGNTTTPVRATDITAYEEA